MNIKNNIEKLFNSEISGNRIAKESGVPQSTVSRFITGESKLGNMKLDHAVTLNNYYIKNKGEVEMKTLNYKGLDLEDKQVDAEIKVNNYEEVINKFERVKYSDVDYANKPNREKLEKIFLNDIVSELEGAIDNEQDYIYIAYENRDNGNIESMELDFKVEKLDEYSITIVVK